MQEVAEEIQKGIELIKDTSKFTDAAFAALSQHAFAVILGEEDESAVTGCWVLTLTDITGAKELSSVDPITLKQSFSTLVTLILQFSKLNADGDQVK
jgi:hypothetical protein